MIGIVTAVLPLLLKLIGFFFDKYNASEEDKKVIRDLIRRSKGDGLISVQNADAHDSNRSKVIDMIKKDSEDGPEAS